MNSVRRTDFEEMLPKFYKLYILSIIFAASFIAVNLLLKQISSENTHLFLLILMMVLINFFLVKGFNYSHVKDTMIQLHSSGDEFAEIRKIESKQKGIFYKMAPYIYLLIINQIIYWTYSNDLEWFYTLSLNILIFILLCIELFRGMQSKAQVKFFLNVIDILIEEDEDD